VPRQHLQLVAWHAVVRESRQRFVPQVVPAQVDLAKDVTLARSMATLPRCRLDAASAATFPKPTGNFERARRF